MMPKTYQYVTKKTESEYYADLFVCLAIIETMPTANDGRLNLDAATERQRNAFFDVVSHFSKLDFTELVFEPEKQTK